MSEVSKILQMLSEGKVTAEEAKRLLALVDAPESATNGQAVFGGRSRRKYLRVTVEPYEESGQPASQELVNVRVPLALIRAGMKFTALIPQAAADRVNKSLKEQGIDIDVRKIDAAKGAEGLADALADIEIDVQDAEHRVRVFGE